VQNSIKVCQIKQHGRLKQVTLFQPKDLMAGLQEDLDVTKAEKL